MRVRLHGLVLSDESVALAKALRQFPTSVTPPASIRKPSEGGAAVGAEQAHRELVRRLAGDASTGYRSTDHSGEIAWLRLRALLADSRQEELTFLVAAELLQSHDETGCSLDNWTPCRAFVEHLLGHRILENQV